MKPEDFILNSNYATLSNDGTETFSVTIPGSSTVPGGSTRQWTQTKTVGVQGGLDIMQVSFPGSGGWVVGPIVILNRTGTEVGFGPIEYSILLQVSRSSPTEITAYAEIYQPFIGNLITNSSSITFDFHVTTFIPPFS